MIVLSIPPLPRRQNLRHHLPTPPLVARLLRHLVRLLLLLRGVDEDTATVLRSFVWPLRVARRGIVHSVEEDEKVRVWEGGGVEGELHGFGVLVLLAMRLHRLWARGKLTTGGAGTHAAVTGTRSVTADITYARVVEALVGEFLAEHVLDAPEAAGSEGGLLGASGDGAGGCDGEGGAGGEGAEEAGDEGGHCG